MHMTMFHLFHSLTVSVNWWLAATSSSSWWEGGGREGRDGVSEGGSE